MKNFDKIISKISSKDGLTDDESYFSFSYILEGNANEDQIEKFLLGLRERGEKIEEITAATKVMREKSSKVSLLKMQLILAELVAVDPVNTIYLQLHH